jgi:hypothetical protein
MLKLFSIYGVMYTAVICWDLIQCRWCFVCVVHYSEGGTEEEVFPQYYLYVVVMLSNDVRNGQLKHIAYVRNIQCQNIYVVVLVGLQ